MNQMFGIGNIINFRDIILLKKKKHFKHFVIQWLWKGLILDGKRKLLLSSSLLIEVRKYFKGFIVVKSYSHFVFVKFKFIHTTRIHVLIFRLAKCTFWSYSTYIPLHDYAFRLHGCISYDTYDIIHYMGLNTDFKH